MLFLYQKRNIIYNTSINKWPAIIKINLKFCMIDIPLCSLNFKLLTLKCIMKNKKKMLIMGRNFSCNKNRKKTLTFFILQNISVFFVNHDAAVATFPKKKNFTFIIKYARIAFLDLRCFIAFYIILLYEILRTHLRPKIYLLPMPGIFPCC